MRSATEIQSRRPSFAAAECMIGGYTREAGVWRLAAVLGEVCAKVVRRRSEGDTAAVEVTPEQLAGMLGAPRHRAAEVAGRRAAGGRRRVTGGDGGAERMLVAMPDASWLAVFGAVTGAIGAISGIAGAILGFKGYRRANAVKALDLRLELRRAVSDARSGVEALPRLMGQADLSRRAVLNARGMSRSGVMTAWEQSYAADQQRVGSLNAELPGDGEDHAAMNDHAQLESSLVHIHSLTRSIDELKKKYENELAKDEATRNALRADVRNRLVPPG